MKAQVDGLLGSTPRPEMLVAIPSSPDPVAALALGLRCKTLLLLRTEAKGGQINDNIAAIETWLTHWPVAGPTPKIQTCPEEPGETIATERLIGEIESVLVRRKTWQVPANVAYLATGGTKAHTTALARHGECVGSPVFLLTPDYKDGRPVPGTGNIVLDEPPREVLRRDGHRRARAAVRSRRFDAAYDALERIPEPRGEDSDLLRWWIDAWAYRDAMRFREAADAARKIESNGRGLPRSPETEILCQAAAQLAEWCDRLHLEATTEPAEPRLGLLLEIMERGAQERDSKRYNHTSLMYYRAIEMILGERLRTAWGIDDSDAAPEGRAPSQNPGDGALPTATDLEAGFRQIASELGLHLLNPRSPLALLDKLVLLIALDDPRFPPPGEARGWAKRLQEAGRSRNAGLFAHGYKPVETSHLDTIEALLGIQDPDSGVLRLLWPRQKLSDLAMLRRSARGPHLSDDGRSLQRG